MITRIEWADYCARAAGACWRIGQREPEVVHRATKAANAWAWASIAHADPGSSQEQADKAYHYAERVMARMQNGRTPK